jgi:hypothetical protein
MCGVLLGLQQPVHAHGPRLLLFLPHTAAAAAAAVAASPTAHVRPLRARSKKLCKKRLLVGQEQQKRTFGLLPVLLLLLLIAFLCGDAVRWHWHQIARAL